MIGDQRERSQRSFRNAGAPERTQFTGPAQSTVALFRDGGSHIVRFALSAGRDRGDPGGDVSHTNGVVTCAARLVVGPKDVDFQVRSIQCTEPGQSRRSRGAQGTVRLVGMVCLGPLSAWLSSCRV